MFPVCADTHMYSASCFEWPAAPCLNIRKCFAVGAFVGVTCVTRCLSDWCNCFPVFSAGDLTLGWCAYLAFTESILMCLFGFVKEQKGHIDCANFIAVVSHIHLTLQVAWFATMLCQYVNERGSCDVGLVLCACRCPLCFGRWALLDYAGLGGWA
jgi:hypothetical protein